MSLTAWCIVLTGAAAVGVIGYWVRKNLITKWRWEDVAVDVDGIFRKMVNSIGETPLGLRSLNCFADWLKSRNGGISQRVLSKDLLEEFEAYTHSKELTLERVTIYYHLHWVLQPGLEIDTHYLHDIIQKWLKVREA